MNPTLRALAVCGALICTAPAQAAEFMPDVFTADSFDGYTDLAAWAAAVVPSGSTVHITEALEISNGFSPVPALLLGISNGFSPQLLVLTEDACTGSLLADACYQGYSVLIGSTLEGIATSPLGLTVEQHIYEPNTSGGLSETGYATLSLDYDSTAGTASGDVTLYTPAGLSLATRDLETNDPLYFTGSSSDMKYGLAGSLLSLASLAAEHGDLAGAGSALSIEYVLAEAYAGGQLSGWEMFGVSSVTTPFIHATADWDTSKLLKILERMDRWIKQITEPWCFPIRDPETGDWIDPITGESLSPWVVDETGY